MMLSCPELFTRFQFILSQCLSLQIGLSCNKKVLKDNTNVKLYVNKSWMIIQKISNSESEDCYQFFVNLRNANCITIKKCQQRKYIWYLQDMKAFSYALNLLMYCYWCFTML